jgi:hypothetical protein
LLSCGYSAAVRGEDEEDDCWLQLVDVFRVHVSSPLPDVIELQLPHKVTPTADEYMHENEDSVVNNRAVKARKLLLHPAVEELLWELVIAYIAWGGGCMWIREIMAVLLTSGPNPGASHTLI